MKFKVEKENLKKILFAVAAVASLGAFAAVPFKIGIAGYTFHKKNVDQTIEAMKELDLHSLCVKDFHLKLDCTQDEADAFKAKLAEATKNEALAAFVKDEASAAALLAEVKSEYKTCPVKAFQIAAVTQYVMLPGKAGRALWTEQLLAFAEKAEQPDVKMFYIDQLRWCGLKAQAGKVVEIGKASGKKCVQEFAEQVATELSGEAMSKMLGK